MLVRATQRGQFDGRIYNAGEVFDCPADEVAHIILGPNGLHLGWVEQVHWAPLPHKRIRSPTHAVHGDGMGPPGGEPDSEQNQKLKVPGMFHL